ncbi:hypothetical protein KDI_24710 [Dictyobacter arantiisoli]|uniref:Uncharacterized protein n=1 Tax=Dictyobacter arantiisoli TaxID=2014874 RepID=A0A5A5TC54_9CHLR|nr:hypothetical protein KDI_24710 [Dictyobacter arantiisoli]
MLAIQCSRLLLILIDIDLLRAGRISSMLLNASGTDFDAMHVFARLAVRCAYVSNKRETQHAVR